MSDNIDIKQIVDKFVGLKTREGTKLGVLTARPLRDPVFIRASLLLLCYGCVSGLLVFLEKAGYAERRFADFYAVALHLVVLMGGLHLFGALTARRAAMIVISIIGFQSWEFFFHDAPKVLVFYPVFACWLLFYWTSTEPETMSRFGMRKGRLASDFAKSALVGALVLAYTLAFVNNWGFSFDFDIWKVAAHFAVMWSQALITFNLIYAVWNRLEERGLTNTGALPVFATMIAAIHLPYFVFFSFLGTIPIESIIGGFIAETLIMTLVMSLTFKRMRTSFAVCFVMSAMNEVLLMAGII